MKLSEAQAIAFALMNDHKLFAWNFSFDRAKTRVGCCRFSDRTITLSHFFTELNEEGVVRESLLHEIAHALVGPKHNHDHVWKEKVVEIGGKPKVKFFPHDIVLPLRKYTALCPECRKSFQADKKRNVACRTCCTRFNRGKYDAQYKIVFRKNEALIPVVTYR